MLPLTNYAESHGADIAYRVVGRGRRDIVWMPPFATHLDMQWELPEWRELLDGLAKLGGLSSTINEALACRIGALKESLRIYVAMIFSR